MSPLRSFARWPKAAHRRALSAEAGLTAVEMLVASALLISVSVIGFSAVGTIYGLSNRTLDTAQSATASGLVMGELRQEGVSANIVFDPSTEGTNAGTNPDGSAIPPGFSLRIYTQNNGFYSCVQWRLLDTGELQTRQWPNGQTPPNWSSASTLLSGVVNYSPPAPFTNLTKPFVLDANSAYYGLSSSGGRLLDVDLILDQHKTETPVEIRTSIAGRDAWYYPANSGLCAL